MIEGDTRLVRSQHRSVLLITHDIEEAVSLSDRVIVLSHRPTRIRSVYDVELGADRTDMMAARDSKNFTDYVRSIWRDRGGPRMSIRKPWRHHPRSAAAGPAGQAQAEAATWSSASS